MQLPAETIEQAKRIDMLALAERYTQLKKIAPREWAGPCPKCGGTDRFHVWPEENSFNCLGKDNGRGGCGAGGDTIEFIRWIEGVSFPEAVQRLTNCALPTVERMATPEAAPRPQAQAEEWKQRATMLAANAQQELVGRDKRGIEYLERRGISEDTMAQFYLGFAPAVAVPGTEGKVRAPAIVMPWVSPVAGVFAVRFRFLEPQDGHRLTAMCGSKFQGRLYGSQGLPDGCHLPVPEHGKPLEALSTLLIVEGEINAMSVWQVAHETRLDVLSVGSESSHLTPTAVEYTQRYKRVIVWLDRAEIVKRLAAQLPDAYGVRSPLRKGTDKKMDANDMLQAGVLSAFLSAVRVDAARDANDMEALLWDLYDAASLPGGIDAGTAAVVAQLAQRLGRGAKLVEPDHNGRWVAA